MFLVSAGYLLVTSWLRINEAHNEVRESLANDGVLAPTAVHRPTLGTSGVVGKLYHVPWSTVIGWHILEQFFFYATGHQVCSRKVLNEEICALSFLFPIN